MNEHRCIKNLCHYIALSEARKPLIGMHIKSKMHRYSFELKRAYVATHFRQACKLPM